MVETYKKMWRFMENRKPPVFTSTYGDGIARVLDGNYAFLMESTMLDYVVQRNCNLTQIGGLLDTKGRTNIHTVRSPTEQESRRVKKEVDLTCERGRKGCR